MIRRLLFLLLLGLWHCANDQTRVSGEDSPPPEAARPETPVARGMALADQYCGTCHLTPAPELLDKASWEESVLPNMAARMGLRPSGYDPFSGMAPERMAELKNLGIYPETPLLDEEARAAIEQYYLATAPSRLPTQEHRTPVSLQPPPFSVQQIDLEGGPFPQVTLCTYDAPRATLYIGNHQNLYALSREGTLTGSWALQSPAVDLAVEERGTFLLCIGQFDPSDKREGVFFPLTLEGGQRADDLVITELPRPVQFATGDLNGDGQEDLVICGFGNHRGQLAWYDHYQKDKAHVLSELPGARKAVIRDLDGDGRMDITVLMAQAWEKLVVYYNLGNGRFREETLLAFPAVYGSSYFEFADFNDDGLPDILLTNGDNWDYSTVDKPYHGIRIYLNRGDNTFSEHFFFPMYGCSEARAVDFDRDGDLDIAAIAFYHDSAKHPERGFVYLENQGTRNFSAHYLNETASGKWLRMDVGDFNGDGYEDIFLGSYFHNINELSKVMLAGVEAFPEVLLLTYSMDEALGD